MTLTQRFLGTSLALTLLMSSIAHGSLLETIQANWSDDPDPASTGGVTVIMAAARAGWPQTVEFLLSAGADPDLLLQDGRTPLLVAASTGSGKSSIYRILLAAGANPAATTKDGRTALMWVATRVTNPAVVRILAAAGASIDVQDSEGNTALMMASRHNWNAAMIDALLDAGADATLKNTTGSRALDFATANPRLQQHVLTLKRLRSQSSL